MRTKASAETLPAWLKANLSRTCLAELGSRDYAALLAAVQVVHLYEYDRSPAVALAFGAVVARMQPESRWLAFHAIAHVLDWDHRPHLWDRAGLRQRDLENKPECAWAPGGTARR